MFTESYDTTNTPTPNTKHTQALPLPLVEPHLLEAKRQLSWTLAQGPLHVTALWELWLGLRTELQRRYKEENSARERRQQQGASSSAAAAAGLEDDWEGKGRMAWEASLGSGAGSPVGGRLLQQQQQQLEVDPLDPSVAIKASRGGVRTRVIGRSAVLEPWQVLALERALPEMQQVGG